MRRLLSFDCEGAELAASLDEAPGAEMGLLMATGGSQTRAGSHRMYERLASQLVQHGISCFRYDRRGVGDSSGEDPGFRGSGPDIAAAAKAFRTEAGPRRLIGFGLCDGATALALFADRAGLDGIILVNPWLVEAESGEPPAAAVRAHYLERLRSLHGWKRLLGGSVDYRKILKGVAKIASGDRDTGLAGEVASALKTHGTPAALILADRDATAIAAQHALSGPAFRGIRLERETISTDSHTFARPGDEAALAQATLRAIKQLSAQAG